MNGKVVGLVTEYNPFHNGHQYHLNKAKEISGAEHSVIVMSGNFTQRGEPAIFDKFLRAKMAVSSGADLVIEIPTVFATSSAEYFAFGSVELLESLGIVDFLVFGSENGEIDSFNELNRIIENNKELLQSSIVSFLKEGISYPAARERAFGNILTGDQKILLSPNNILGIEYLKALEALNSKIVPLTLKRIGSDYSSKDIQGELSSATSIRSYMENSSILPEGVIPESAKKVIMDALDSGVKPVFEDYLTDLILYKLRTMSNSQLALIHDVSEGLENSFIKHAVQAGSVRELLHLIKSKRYTLTRLKRIIIKTLLDMDDSFVGPCGHLTNQYIRILAFNENGRALINQIKSRSKLPIITNLSKTPDEFIAKNKLLQMDIKAGNIYSTIRKDNKKAMTDYTTSPFYLKK